MLLRVLALLVLPATALAQRDASREALTRLEETLTMRIEDGTFDINTVLPALVVSTEPAFEESRSWYPTAALSSLITVFGNDGLRMCEACMSPRTFVQDGYLQASSGQVSTAEIIRLDEGARGDAIPARAAIWLDETEEGVSLRIVDLGNSRIVVAENLDPMLTEMTRSKRTFTLARELERRARGDSITQTFIDVAAYPSQHVSMDWTEQWGDTNCNLSGLSISFFDPVLGIGGAYYRVVPDALNVTVGGQILMSVPTALVRGISGQSVDIIDPLLTAAFVFRVPFGGSSYGLNFIASTNGRFGVGISMLNTSLLPFLP